MVSLAAKVAFLSRADSYAEGADTVETKETHMSWVFLTDDYAYKLKKPVRTSFLDYGTIAARRRNCQREVRLNRRLAPGIYLGTVPLRIDARTGLHLKGASRVVDWLVKMKRLPAEGTLEHRIAAGTVRETDIRRLGRILAAFFRSAPDGRGAPHAHLCRTMEAVRADHGELARPRFGLPKEKVNRLAAAQLSFLARHGDLLQGRAEARRIREGHGDLRPEHVYCNGTPIVMDCLEFNRRLRMLDPVDELAYLAMECERLGNERVGRWLFDTYRRETGDFPPRGLIDFYKCSRAYLRAKISIWHIADVSVPAPERWRRRAHQYLACAENYARRLDGTGPRKGYG